MGKCGISSIVITGYGSVTAAGDDSDSAFEGLQRGLVKSTMISEEFFRAPFSAPCFCAPAEGEFRFLGDLIQDREQNFNRTIIFALRAIDEALDRSGHSLDELAGYRVGAALGTTVGCTFHNEPYYSDWKNGRDVAPDPLFTYFNSNLAECIQHILGLDGPRVVITNACASGADAIGVAKSWLESGLCDIAVAGGVDELSRVACHGFNSLMLVSDKNCKPFDRDREGLNLGEGAGIMVLEKETALSKKQQIHGWVRGYGAAGDAYHPTTPHPEGRGLQRAFAIAMEDAGLQPGDIAMINAHGTGTAANDRAEMYAISQMGLVIDSLPIVSTKGATGHTLGAAGAVEAVFTLKSLNSGQVFGTPGCISPDPDFPLVPLVESEYKVLKGKIGMSQSLAFGGSNTVLIIEGTT